MSKVDLCVITQGDWASGFRLAGVEIQQARTRQEARNLIQKFLESLKPSLIAIEEDLYPLDDKKLQKHLEEKPFPVLLSIPKVEIEKIQDQQGYVSELVRSCIGYYVKLK